MEALTFPSYLIRKALASMKGKDHSGTFNHEGKLRQGLSKKVPTIKWLGKRVI